MADFLDAAGDIDQSTLDVQGAQYPYIQWVNGQSALKPVGGVIYTGGWFMPGDQVDGEPDGWEAGELAHGNNTATAGFFARDIAVAVVRSRRAWFVSLGGNYQQFPWAKFDRAKALGSPRGKLQVLTLVKGLEAFGAIVLTMKGSTSRAFSSSRRGRSVLDSFDAGVVKEADKLVPRRKDGTRPRFARRAFWLTVGPDRDSAGVPVYETVGRGTDTSFVTLPVALGIPVEPTKEALGALFVGYNTLPRVEELYTEGEAWAAAWDAFVQREPEPGNGGEAAGEVDDEGESEIPFR